jgi:hypothetical protein
MEPVTRIAARTDAIMGRGSSVDFVAGRPCRSVGVTSRDSTYRFPIHGLPLDGQLHSSMTTGRMAGASTKFGSTA